LIKLGASNAEATKLLTAMTSAPEPINKPNVAANTTPAVSTT